MGFSARLAAGFRPDTRASERLPDLPLVVWMVLASLAIGLIGGMAPTDLVGAFNTGFGRALGDFALILLPSFTLAAALSHRGIASAGAERVMVTGAPIAGAGMICPDTAYAALAAAAGRRRLDVAFGSYTGFKLIYPAGPLIVATGLGVSTEIAPSMLALCGIGLAIPVWAVGVLWSRSVGKGVAPDRAIESFDGSQARKAGLVSVFAPFGVLAVLLICGGILSSTGLSGLDFLLAPKGALLVAATVALGQTQRDARRACLDSAVHRTASLLLIIGAASAFGAILTGLIPLASLIPQGSGASALLGLFALTATFKGVQGSSMATFTAIAPVAAPIVAASGVAPVAAVYAICLGSFVAILPNDSFYWLVRRDAFDATMGEVRAIRTLAGGSTLQAVFGLLLLLIFMAVAT